ncbi:MAG: hypothetical protein Q7K29_08310 [Thermoleophilia bacterium]|nr:hypothetical protein [Thermoleophilia bacterium]
MLLAIAAAGCGSDTSAADKLMDESDSLRNSAVDKLRMSTGAIDNLVRSAAAGQTLPATQTKTTATTAVQDLNKALADLTTRDRNLRSASEMPLNENYMEYLKLMRESNDKLTETVNAALEIPRLLEKEQYSLAGWDEIRTQVVVSQIYSMQGRIETLNTEAELLRTRAEQIRKDNPEDFGN